MTNTIATEEEMPQYTTHCTDKYYLKGELSDECIARKMGRGLAPGMATGLHVWAEEVKRSDRNVDGDGVRGFDLGVGDGEGMSRSTSVGKGEAIGGSGIQQQDGDVEDQMRTAALVSRQRPQSRSTVDSGYADYNTSTDKTTTFERHGSPLTAVSDGICEGFPGVRKIGREAPGTVNKGMAVSNVVGGRGELAGKLDVEDEDRNVVEDEDGEDWMWGGMTNFDGEAA